MHTKPLVSSRYLRLVFIHDSSGIAIFGDDAFPVMRRHRPVAWDAAPLARERSARRAQAGGALNLHSSEGDDPTGFALSSDDEPPSLIDARGASSGTSSGSGTTRAPSPDAAPLDDILSGDGDEERCAWRFCEEVMYDQSD